MNTSPPPRKVPLNTIKAGLRKGHNLCGLWLSLGSCSAAELAAVAGFDWLLIDAEHSPNELPDVLAQVRAIQRTCAVVVRPAANDPDRIKRLLDIGVQTLLIPFVGSPREAAAAVAATRYAPRGTRGFSSCTRANSYGRTREYARNAESQICLIVQIETRDALEHLEAIAQVDGVSAVFVGAADLSVEFGHPGNISHPVVWGAVLDAVSRLRAIEKPAGILVSRRADAGAAIRAGFQFVGLGSDSRLLATACEDVVADWKAESEK